jgi:hypothetical protein
MNGVAWVLLVATQVGYGTVVSGVKFETEAACREAIHWLSQPPSEPGFTRKDKMGGFMTGAACIRDGEAGR